MLFNAARRVPRVSSRVSQPSATMRMAIPASYHPLQTQRRLFALTAHPRSEPKHTAESYFKDVDSEAPADSKTHTVDSASDAVQRPLHPPSGAYSRAGAQTEEYRHVDKENSPYNVPADGAKGERLRYGGREAYSEEKKHETSKPEEGPAAGSAGGRKPEGTT